MNVDIGTLFTEKRFKKSKSEVSKILEQLDDSTANYEKLIERLLDEDIMLKKRLQRFRKWMVAFFISGLGIVAGVFFRVRFPMLYLLLVVVILAFIVSVVGMIKNRVSVDKRKYLTS